ncbi:MAG: DUF998 domain-containing protein [Saccharospirillum sp.]
MNTKASLLSVLSATLLVGLPWWLGWQVPNYAPSQFISELGALDAPSRSLANGAFFLIGAFWMGTVEAVRKQLEPAPMDRFVRFGAIGFAASYIISVVFPCDAGCPVDGSVSQWLHNTLIWVLYAGAMLAAARLRTPAAPAVGAVLKGLMLLCFVLLQYSAIDRDWAPGYWQRGYEACFAVLWLLWVLPLSRPGQGRNTAA